jgi:hypothetical protein
MTYHLQLIEKSDNAIVVAAEDEQPLAVIRDEVKLHGYHVGPIEKTSDGYRFEAQADEAGKAREFLMSLDDVEITVHGGKPAAV